MSFPNPTFLIQLEFKKKEERGKVEAGEERRKKARERERELCQRKAHKNKDMK